MTNELLVRLKRPHGKQQEFIDSPAKRKVIRAGRRSGKTTGIAIYAVQQFLAGHRILYAAPTSEQIDRFWVECKRALEEPIDTGHLYKNETLHIIEMPGTETRIRAKTAWDADSLRGDYADVLILDEWQLMNEEAWDRVGAPMLVDNDGDAVFIYTPPSLHSRSRTKANDPRHAAKLFKRAAGDESGRWQAFHFTSFDNPHISHTALDELTADMTALSYAQEIMAEDKDEAPGALWTRDLIKSTRVDKHPELLRVAIGVDPPGGAVECGIVAAGIARIDGELHGYVIEDASLFDGPGEWGAAIVRTFNRRLCDRVYGEVNYGGDMVENTIRTVEGGKSIPFTAVRATRGKAVRAEPVAALYERGRVHHVGSFSILEDELCTWEPHTGQKSPNRLDALVWVLTALMVDVPSELHYLDVRARIGSY